MSYSTIHAHPPILSYVLGPYEFSLEKLQRRRVNYDYVSSVTVAVYREGKLCARVCAAQFPYKAEMYPTNVEQVCSDEGWTLFTDRMLDQFARIVSNAQVGGLPKGNRRDN